MGGGLSFGPYWPLFSSLRPQDVFSKGLVHLPRKGRLHFPCTESRISAFLFCQTTQYVCTNIVHRQRMHIFPLMLLLLPLYDICSPPLFKPFRICKRRKFELNAQRENRGSRVSSSLHSRIAGLKRFMPPTKSEDLEI